MSPILPVFGLGAIALLFFTASNKPKKKEAAPVIPPGPVLPPVLPPVTLPPVTLPPVSLPGPGASIPSTLPGPGTAVPSPLPSPGTVPAGPLPSPATPPAASDLPSPAPPKPPSKPVENPRDAIVNRLRTMIPAYEPSMSALTESQAVSNYVRAAVVRYLQSTYAEQLYKGEIPDPGYMGEALAKQGWTRENKAPIAQQVIGIYDAVSGDTMRDKSVVESWRKGALTKDKLRTIMVASPGTLRDTSPSRYREAVGDMV